MQPVERRRRGGVRGWSVKRTQRAAKFSGCVRCSSEAVTGSFGFAEIEMIFIEIYAPFT